MNTQNKLRPFGIRDKAGYLLGDLGNDFTFLLSTMMLTKFYTDVMGVPAGIIGTIMMLARFVDAFTDVTMGRIADRCKPTASGKFKPWLVRMCIPVAIASFLMYAPGFASEWVQQRSTGVRIGYLAITYLLWGSFCYTGINIPYGSMASAISADPGDRQSLSTFRSMGSVLAGVFVGVGLPMVAYDKVTLADGTIKEVLIGSKVAMAAAVFSVLAVISYLLCHKLVTERIVPQKDGDQQKNTDDSVTKHSTTSFLMLRN